MIPDSAALKLASLGPRMFQRHEVLRADDGHTFRNPVREELPTICPQAVVCFSQGSLMTSQS